MIRDKASNPHKLSEDIIKNVCDHIQCFPSNVSHYTREHHLNRQYLNENLNVQKMYMMYEGKCSELNLLPVKEHMYRHIFNTRFNLHFKAPRKDICKRCNEYKIKIDAESSNQEAIKKLEDEHELHLRKAQRNIVRHSMKEDTENAKCSNNIYVKIFNRRKTIMQENLYPSVRPVSAAKKKDMLDLLKFILPIHHGDDESNNE